MSSAEKTKVEGIRSPEVKANWFSKLSFWWANSLVLLGKKRPLQQEDLWPLVPEDHEDALYSKFKSHWVEEQKKPIPSLKKAMFKTVGPYFATSWILYAIYVASLFVGPQMLKEIVIFLQDPRVGWKWGYYYTAIIFFSMMAGSFANYYSQLVSMRTAARIRVLIVSIVYHKTLHIASAGSVEGGAGTITNFIGADAQRVVELFPILNPGIFAIPMIGVTIGLLYDLIGPYTFVGLGVMFLSGPINGNLAKKLTVLRRETVKWTDTRMKITTEIIEAMKVIKMYAWEHRFSDAVKNARGEELKLNYKNATYRSLLITLFIAVPTVTSVVVFATYSIENKLTPATIFAAFAYFNILRLPLGILPFTITIYTQFVVSMKRIQDFLATPEINKPNLSNNESAEKGITAEGCHFQYDRPAEKPKDPKEGAKGGKSSAPTTPSAKGSKSAAVPIVQVAEILAEVPPAFSLKNITFTLKRGEMVVGVGPVGSGKSTLCAGLLGEVRSSLGKLSVNGEVAYVAQQAFIVNASVRDNILFGKPYDEERYNAVIKACALEPDFHMFANGDMTEIGERGANLSGGQRQRVSIARAAYSNADIVILDDCLSAVDAHVGRHLYNQCIRGLLRDKAVLMVTNQLQYISEANCILFLNSEGQLAASGTFAELMEQKGPFFELMQSYGVLSTHEQEKEKEEEEVDPKKVEEVEKEEMEEEKKKKKGALVIEEEREVGAIPWSTWRTFLGFSHHKGAVIGCIVFFMFEASSQAINTWWLSVWSDQTRPLYPGMPKPVKYFENNDAYLGIYVALGISVALIVYCRFRFLFYFFVSCSGRLHDMVFRSVLRAPMSFFDTTPLGRILNRFSKDVDTLDNLLPPSIGQTVGFLLQTLATIAMIAVATPEILAAVGPAAVVYWMIFSFFRHTSREVQRLESISRSPVFAKVNETLSGLSTIRAYRSEKRFLEQQKKNIDANNQAFMAIQILIQWLGIRLDLLANIVTGLCALILSINRVKGDVVNPSTAAMSLSYALALVGFLNRVTNMAVDAELKMNSVERIINYSNLNPEAALEKPEDVKVSPEWPPHGAIEFKDVHMRYRPELEPVLNGISFNILPGEKVGIVGRTGAGKSTIFLTLFRLVEIFQGSIAVDGIDISSLGLHTLRNRLAIIPQEPVMFIGTVRSNLDPFGDYKDEELWQVLEDVQLKSVVENFPKKLEEAVVANGDNFSVGQRQLICLGRAILRKSKILVLDEASASVDFETDSVMQQIIRQRFADATILTIAHRLNTIVDSDRILVLNAGQVAEFDVPAVLLENPKGVLTELVNNTGEQSAANLVKIANENRDKATQRLKDLSLRS